MQILIRIMTIIVVLIICLANKVTHAVGVECRNALSCPCGSTRENVAVCAPDAISYAEVCKRLSKCASCKDRSNVCVKCLEGLDRSLCYQERSKSHQKRQINSTRPFRPRPRTGAQRPMNGNWGEWSKWGECSCKNGQRKRFRACDNPAPVGGGRYCLGPSTRTGTCSMNQCRSADNLNPEYYSKPPRQLTYCSYPGDIANGRVNISSLNEKRRHLDESQEEYPEGSRLHYSCLDGYVLESPNSLTCTNTGKWSVAHAKCIPARRPLAYCQYPGDIDNGQVNTLTLNEKRRLFDESEGEYPEGSRLQYSCVVGYALEGPTSLTCTSKSNWSAAPPKCIPDRSRPISCNHPGTVGNAHVVHIPPLRSRQRPTDQPWEEYPAGSQLQYTCDYGYTLEGPFVLYCQNNGRWTAEPPVCITEERSEIMYCENPGIILNGRVSPATNHTRRSNTDEYPEQAVLEYSCDEGYRLQGRRSLTCQSTGHWSGDIPSCIPDCGRSFMQTHNRVINGSKTISGDWPWVVSISVDNDGRASFICGGAVLNIHTVITAAHCLTAPFVLGKTLILRFGKHKFEDEGDDDEVLVRRSSRVIVHPDYSNKSYDSDIGLVFFQQRIRYSLRVQPLCLPTRESTAQNVEPERVGYVAGWGVTEVDSSPEIMLLASLPVVSNGQCMNAYKQQNLVVTSNMFCAGYEDARQSVCVGDSGSPYVFYDRRIKRYILEGLVSFTVTGQCGVAGKYAIFTKVFRFLDWIIKLY